MSPQQTSHPVDLVHLSRRTAGDRSLEREVLSLFVRQCDRYLDRLHAARDARAREDAAHAIAGTAKAVGAFALARAACELEGRAASEDLCDCGHVDREVERTSRYVTKLLRERD